MICTDPLPGVRYLPPQLEHPGQHRELLRVRHRLPGLPGRLPCADQRAGRVVGRMPVVCLLNRGPAGLHQPRIGADGLGEPAMHLAALAGQQLIVHGLPDQRVPERIAVGVGEQHICRHGGPYRPGQNGAIHAGDHDEQPVTSPLAAGARDPDHLLCLLRQPAQAGYQQVAQRLRQPGAQLPVTKKGLDEQRVALGAAIHGREQLITRPTADDPGHEPVSVRTGEPAQIHPGDPADAAKLGQQRAKRVGTAQLIGPVGHHDQHAVEGRLVTDQECQQVRGRTVRPVQVLDEQDHRAGFGQALQQDEHLLEQPRPRLAGVICPGRLAELRQQPGQLPGRAARQQLSDRGGAEVTHEPAEHRGKRGERQAVRAKLQAAAGQHPRTRVT